MKYYIGDMRYCGRVNDRYDVRPFENAGEMNMELSKRWNAIVKPTDIVYVLGNMCCGRPSMWEEYVGSLTGRKVLITGEFDYVRLRASVYHLFDYITPYTETTDHNRRIILCHYPILQYHKCNRTNTFMFYSQSRNIEVKMQTYKIVQKIRNKYYNGATYNVGQVINVAANQPYMDFTPRTLEQLTIELDSGRMYNERPTIRETYYGGKQIIIQRAWYKPQLTIHKDLQPPQQEEVKEEKEETEEQVQAP